MSPRVVSIGEVLWDLLPSGPQLGGAPGNLAVHVRAFGGNSALISRVGDDALGRQARDQLSARGVNLDSLETDPTAPTGTVKVELNASREHRFTIVENVAWDRIASSDAARAQIAAADAVCFGTLAQRTPEAHAVIQSLLRSAASSASRLILCDINLRDPHPTPEVIESSLQLATALKLNETELPVLAKQFGLTGSLEDRVTALARRFDLDGVLLTLGASGSRVWYDGTWTSEPGRTVPVVDTVGAGDSFTAAFVMGRLMGAPIPETMRIATDIAAYVCTRPGATPLLPPDLSGVFLRNIA